MIDMIKKKKTNIQRMLQYLWFWLHEECICEESHQIVFVGNVIKPWFHYLSLENEWKLRLNLENEIIIIKMSSTNEKITKKKNDFKLVLMYSPKTHDRMVQTVFHSIIRFKHFNIFFW